MAGCSLGPASLWGGREWCVTSLSRLSCLLTPAPSPAHSTNHAPKRDGSETDQLLAELGLGLEPELPLPLHSLTFLLFPVQMEPEEYVGGWGRFNPHLSLLSAGGAGSQGTLPSLQVQEPSTGEQVPPL